MTLVQFGELLKTVTGAVWHYEAHKQTAPYIVWMEYGRRDFYADDTPYGGADRVQVSLFTKKEFDPLKAKLRKILSKAGVPFIYSGCMYESDTRLIHHVYDCEVIGDAEEVE